MSEKQRCSLVSPENSLSIRRQCKLLEVHSSRYYYSPQAMVTETKLINEIKDLWLEHTSKGYRKITLDLRDKNYEVNHKRVLRLMKLMGLRSSLPKPYKNTSIANKADAVHPYLLRGLEINRANQVWATDITYIKLPGGMVYLFALIDWSTRYVVGWKVANTMEAHHAIDVLEDAISKYGKPEIINSDQGSQFTGEFWIGALEGHGIRISHDGVKRCIDNVRIERLWWSVKYEHIHLFCHRTLWELEKGLMEYFVYYNTKRRHQALKYQRPADLYLHNAA